MAAPASDVRGARTSTSVYKAAQTEQYRPARDALLDAPGAFARVDGSVPDAYRRGRMARLYMNATLLNVKRKRFAPAGARFRDALRSPRVYDAVRHKRAFRRGILRTHASRAQ